jgi:NADPH2:quinone reductase
MRAALIPELGQPPEPAEAEGPNRGFGRVLFEISAAALNPLDIAIGSGRFYAGSPPLPYIPGCEGVGRVLAGDKLANGTRVYLFGDGLGLKRDGTMAERVIAGEGAAIPLPDEVDDALAAACGIAGMAGWMAVSARAPVREGDRVLVLGATGTVGMVALQAARILGAERVVAAGRRPDRLARARELGADAVVDLDDAEDLAGAFAEASGGDGPTLIVDPLWGQPIVAALAAAAPGARVVQLGQSAGAEATIPSAHIRGKQLEIYGYTDFAVPPDVFRERYLELVGHAAAGRIQIDIETFPLERVREAWERQAAGPAAKLVVLPLN